VTPGEMMRLKLGPSWASSCVPSCAEILISETPLNIESLREVYMLSQDSNLLSHRKKYRPFLVNLHALRSVVERVELGWSYNLNTEHG
jgi:hypothetical protein